MYNLETKNYMSWYQQKSEVLILKLYIQPGAKHDEIVGIIQDELKIKLASPPIDGLANTSLIKLLSKRLKIPKSTITIISGEKSRHKLLEINCSKIDINKLLASINTFI